MHSPERRRNDATKRLLPWIVLALLAAAWTWMALFSLALARPEEPTSEVTGQITWIDPDANAFGIDTGGEELDFIADGRTVILRDHESGTLQDVQPNDWVVSCVYLLRGSQRLCVRLEIETPPEEEGLE